ncbi:MAG: hypothetical protein ACYC0V_04935 [Armatimonadota bacterium]
MKKHIVMGLLFAVLCLYGATSIISCRGRADDSAKHVQIPEEKAFREDLPSLEKVEITTGVALCTLEWKVKPNQVLGTLDIQHDHDDISALLEEFDKTFDDPLDVVVGISESLRIRFYTSRNKYVYIFRYIRGKRYLYGYERRPWSTDAKGTALDIHEAIPSIMGWKVTKRFDELLKDRLPERIRSRFK